jgi:DtxR family Mn-dependent transcriptional regulator
MVDPRVALLAFAALTAILLVVVWPRRGLWARARRLRRASERVRVEDTLKYVFHRNAAGEPVHADALAGALEIRRSLARGLLDRLIVGGLMSRGPHGALLTDEGRSEALRIIRSHRLLESYFADRTGVAPAEWHELAEEGEHDLSAAEVEQLAARLGQPRYDPHGDPIPTASGELPASAGIALARLADGAAGTVVHLEDEPAEDYERLLAEGLALGKRVVRHGRSNEGIAIEIDGRQLLLSDALAEGVTVERTRERSTAPPRTLADVRRGESARVARVASDCRGAQRRRLLDLGVVPGTEITVEMPSASGDPTAYRIRGALIALRRQQAAWIEVEAA